MLVTHNTVKISDFGVSKSFEGAPNDLMRMDDAGTFLFWAPEAFEGGRVSGKRCDVWAFGISLYIMLFARLPWNMDTEGTPFLLGKVIKDKELSLLQDIL